ncbi:MFS transporter [Haloferax sp. YSMS24]|uniref:MFS transporter n=1 Tax=Haloferax sp. YSMS24 TaxID=3388425 RepID=UPI00398D3795
MTQNQRTRRRPPPVLAKYYLYEATATCGFVTPVFTLFLVWRDLSFTQIGLLGSLTAVVVVGGEIPTGYVSDRFGRQGSLFFGSALLAASLAGFLVAERFVVFAVLYALWALGAVFRSGTIDAWLYETLQTRFDESSFTRVRGRGAAVNQWVSAVMMLSAGVLYEFDPRFPFAASVVTLGVSCVVALSLPAVTTTHDDGEESIAGAVTVLKGHLTKPPLRSTVLYLGLFLGVTSAANTYVPPILTGPVGFPETSLGPIYAGFTVVMATSGYFADEIEARLTTRGAIVCIPAVVAVFLLVPLVVPMAALPAFVLVKSARTVLPPLANGYINDRIGSTNRATVLSAASMLYALVRTPLKPLTGVVADVATPFVAIASLGVLFLLGAVLVVRWEMPVRDAASPAD